MLMIVRFHQMREMRPRTTRKRIHSRRWNTMNMVLFNVLTVQIVAVMVIAVIAIVNAIGRMNIIIVEVVIVGIDLCPKLSLPRRKNNTS
jgi:hypothetical protein